jgi:hypothetical protein
MEREQVRQPSVVEATPDTDDDIEADEVAAEEQDREHPETTGPLTAEKVEALIAKEIG